MRTSTDPISVNGLLAHAIYTSPEGPKRNLNSVGVIEVPSLCLPLAL